MAGAGVAAAAAAAEAAWYGQGAGRLVPLTVHDRQRPGKGLFHQPRTTPHGQNKYILENTAVTLQDKTRYLCGVLSLRYGMINDLHISRFPY